MLEIQDPMVRQNDAIIQSSCDRRTLATIGVWLRKNGEPVSSVSSVVRLAMERLRDILITHFDVEDIETSDDATDVLRFLGAGKVNPAGRNVATYVKKMELENAVFEGSRLEQVLEPARKKADIRSQKRVEELTKQFNDMSEEDIKKIATSGEKAKEEAQTRVFRKPEWLEEEPETLAEATARRARESAELKASMAAVPEDIIVEENENAN